MIIIKTPAEIAIMKEGGRRLALIMAELQREVALGVTTGQLEQTARDLIRKKGGQPSFLGYQNYPAALCVARNSVVVHGIPSQDEVLEDGDIIGLDLGFLYQGLHTDMAVTLPVGKIDKTAQRLIKVTQQSLRIAIKAVKVDSHLGDVSSTIQIFVENNGFNVVRDLVGHGVGQKLHEDPKIPNYGLPHTGPVLQAGMTLALEPMVTVGDYQLETSADGWTVKTADGSLSAHFEHTVLVTETGAEILTK